jgi:uncharacterized lipoprotein YmbA
MTGSRILRGLTVSAMILLGLGCGSSAPTRFYVLSPLEDGATTVGQQNIGIGVGPVELPSYLDRPQFVTRSGQNQVTLHDFDHWAEPLDANVAEVLAHNMSILLPVARVRVYPWDPSVELDYQVILELSQFEIHEDNQARLVAWWSVLNGATGEALMSRKTTYRAAVQGDAVTDQVAALNRTLDSLSRDMAATLGQLDRLP